MPLISKVPKKTNPKATLEILAASANVGAIVAWLADAEILGIIRVGLPDVAWLVTAGISIFAWTNWPSIRRCSHAVRFRELHTSISNELRLTQNDLGLSGSGGRPMVSIRVDRLRIVHMLQELKIFAPHPEDTQSWLEFLTLMENHSRTGAVRNARKKYGTAELFYNWENSAD